MWISNLSLVWDRKSWGKKKRKKNPGYTHQVSHSVGTVASFYFALEHPLEFTYVQHMPFLVGTCALAFRLYALALRLILHLLL